MRVHTCTHTHQYINSCAYRHDHPHVHTQSTGRWSVPREGAPDRLKASRHSERPPSGLWGLGVSTGNSGIIVGEGAFPVSDLQTEDQDAGCPQPPTPLCTPPASALGSGRGSHRDRGLVTEDPLFHGVQEAARLLAFFTRNGHKEAELSI